MKILLASEFTHLCTGYSAYYKQLAEAFTEAGHDVAEIASYGDANDPLHVKYANECKWDIYLNIPHNLDKAATAEYDRREEATGDAKFGSWMFEQIALKEKPDIVIGLRDYWYDRYITESPFHDCFTSILSPTVDTYPQKADWLDAFNSADYITTYNEWSENWLKEQYHCRNLKPFISPGFEQRPLIDRNTAREALSIPKDIKLIGTVMRNQGRKKFPDLFNAVSSLDDTYVYCHSAYPDKGWDLPSLFLQYGLQNKVYMSYVCKNCHDFSCELYSQRSAKCKKCGGKIETASPIKGVTQDDLRNIYSALDLYVQPHNSEGFGIPTIEAAMCGIRVVSTNFSAQEDVIKKINAIPINVIAIDSEMRTLCSRAILDVEHLRKILADKSTYEFNRAEVARQASRYYTTDLCKKSWVNLVESVELKKSWEKPIEIKPIPEFNEMHALTNPEYVLYCITKVAQQPRFIGSYTHLLFLDSLNGGSLLVTDKKSRSCKQSNKNR
jgi:glycosyltransferase involved in cell wall biosynthesis